MANSLESSYYKKYTPIVWAGHLYFIAFIIFASALYLERTLIADPVVQIFEMVNTQSYVIFTGRYSMVLPTTLPLLAVKLGLPLKIIHLLYSISTPLITWAVYCLLVYRLKNLAAAILIAFTLAITTHTFYHSISETVQLIAYAALFIGWQEYWISKDFRPVFTGVITTLLTTSLLLFIHPVAIFIWAFSLGYLVIKNRLYRHKFLYLNVLLFLCLIVTKTLLTGQGSHDSTFVPGKEEIFSQLLQLNSNFPLQFFKNAFFSHYLLFIGFFAVSLVYYLIHKRFLMAAFQFFFVVATFLVSLIIYHKPDGYFAMERVFLPFLFFTSYPFLREIYIRPSAQAVVYTKALFVLAVAAFGFYKITEVSGLYKDRLEEVKYLADMANKSDGQKFFVRKHNADFSHLPIPVNISTETLLYSSMQPELKSVTVYLDQGELEQNPVDWSTSENLYLFTNYYLVRDSREFNSKYFQLFGTYSEMTPGVISGDTIHIATSFENYVSGKGYIHSQGIIAGPAPSNNVAFEGDFSLPLAAPEQSYGGNYELIYDHGIIQFEVAVKGNRECSLVITDDKHIYNRYFPEDSFEPGWAKITGTMKIPPNKRLKLYLWNPQQETAYFDNLKIKILQ